MDEILLARFVFAYICTGFLGALIVMRSPEGRWLLARSANKPIRDFAIFLFLWLGWPAYLDTRNLAWLCRRLGKED